MGWGTWAIIFLILLLVTPAAQIGVGWGRRQRARRKLERARGTRVVPIILGLETVATYGVPIARFEQLPLPGEVVAAISATPEDLPVDVVIDMPADLRFDAGPVAAALRERESPTTVFVPLRALTAGLTLARAADRVVLAPDAVIADTRRVPASASGATAGGLHPDDLRRLGLTVEEGIPTDVEHYTGHFSEPSRPVHRLPFYIHVPRTVR